VDDADREPVEFGKYRLDRLIARGGMGEVYRARWVGEFGFENHLVIKTILPEYAATPRFIEMFAAEAKTAVALSHGNIVPIYELGRVADTFYIAMGYVDGPSVEQFVRAWRRPPPREAVAVALHIGRGVLTGLAYAHRDEPGRPAVVHRDISPRNVLLDRSGQVRIVDFGIAVRARERVDVRAGSAGYVAPEQARGEVADPSADVFSTACLLFELITGRPAFPKAGVWSLPELEDVPIELREVLASALSLSASARPPNAGMLLRRLHPALTAFNTHFGDAELGACLAETFPNGWDDAWQPAPSGHAQPFQGSGHTYATRLTAITHAQPLSSGVPSDNARPGQRGAWPRFIALALALFVITGVGILSTSNLAAQRPPTALQRWANTESILAPSESSTPATHLATRPATHDENTFVAADRRTEAPPPDAAIPTENPRPIVAPPSPSIRGDRRPPQTPSRRDEPETPAPPLPDAVDRTARFVDRGRPSEGELQVIAPSVAWAEVDVDGRPRGHTPTRPLPMAAGRHRVEVRCVPDVCTPARVLVQTTVTIAPRERLTLDASR